MSNRTSKTVKQTSVASVAIVARFQVGQELPVAGAEADRMEVDPAVQSVADAAMRSNEGEEGFTVGVGNVEGHHAAIYCLGYARCRPAVPSEYRSHSAR